MSSTFTTHYDLEKGGHFEKNGIWDITLNSNFDIIDNELYSIFLLANNALPRTGGTLTGDVTWNSNALFNSGGIKLYNNNPISFLYGNDIYFQFLTLTSTLSISLSGSNLLSFNKTTGNMIFDKPALFNDTLTTANKLIGGFTTTAINQDTYYIDTQTYSYAGSCSFKSNIRGSATGNHFAIYGSNSCSVGNNYSLYGTSTGGGTNNYAIYGNASGATNNWAGYFDSGNVYILNKIGINNTNPLYCIDMVVPYTNEHGINISQTINTTGKASLNIATNSSSISALNIQGIISTVSGSGPSSYAAILGSSTNTGAGNGIGIQANSSGACTNNYALYAQASGATNNWAGYFLTGNTYIADTLTIGSNNSGHIATSKLYSYNAHIVNKTYNLYLESNVDNYGSKYGIYNNMYMSGAAYGLSQILTGNQDGFSKFGMYQSLNISNGEAGHYTYGAYFTTTGFRPVGISSNVVCTGTSVDPIAGAFSTTGNNTSGYNYGIESAVTGTTFRNCGIYSSASGATYNYAGMFVGDIYCKGKLQVTTAAVDYINDAALFYLDGSVGAINWGTIKMFGTTGNFEYSGYYTGGFSPMYNFIFKKTTSGGNTYFYGSGSETMLSMQAVNGMGYAGVNAAPYAGYSYNFNVGGSAYCTGTWYSSSDVKLKKDIVTIDSALNKIDSLRGVYYIKKDDTDNKRRIGLIAQEVNEILPEVVTISENDHWALSYAEITAVLIEAVKELKIQVDELRK
jgi:hypothetical protein